MPVNVLWAWWPVYGVVLGLVFPDSSSLGDGTLPCNSSLSSSKFGLPSTAKSDARLRDARGQQLTPLQQEVKLERGPCTLSTQMERAESHMPLPCRVSLSLAEFQPSRQSHLMFNMIAEGQKECLEYGKFCCCVRETGSLVTPRIFIKLDTL